MKTDHPSQHHMHQLRRLWQEVFGDSDAFLDSFYRTAYAPDHCLCIFEEDRICAVLYWIDCTLEEQTLAYIYAVATRPDCRGRGLCRQLMADTHALLEKRGYSGAVLVPQEEGLRRMYAGMGYQNAGGLSEFSCHAGSSPVPLKAVDAATFGALRRTFLPAGGIVQEGSGLAFLAEQLLFFAGEDFLLAGFAENHTLHAVELLGNTAAAPGILKVLGFFSGRFRTPGSKKPFAMFHPLEQNAKIPSYLGFAFD